MEYAKTIKESYVKKIIEVSINRYSEECLKNKVFCDRTRYICLQEIKNVFRDIKNQFSSFSLGDYSINIGEKLKDIIDNYLTFYYLYYRTEYNINDIIKPNELLSFEKRSYFYGETINIASLISEFLQFINGIKLNTYGFNCPDDAIFEFKFNTAINGILVYLKYTKLMNADVFNRSYEIDDFLKKYL